MENPVKKAQSEDENQQQNSAISYINNVNPRNKTQAILMGGEHFQHYTYTLPAPLSLFVSDANFELISYNS